MLIVNIELVIFLLGCDELELSSLTVYVV